MKMLNTIAIFGLLAFALPVVAEESKKVTRRITVQKLRSGESDSLKKLAFWVATIIAPQLLARWQTYLTPAGANLITAGGLAHLLGEVFERDGLQSFGINTVYLGTAFEICQQPKLYVSKGLDWGWDKASAANGDGKVKANVDASYDAGALVKPVLLAAVIKLAVEQLPALYAASQTPCPEVAPAAGA